MVNTHNEALSAAIFNSLNRVKDLEPEKVLRFCEKLFNGNACSHMCDSCKMVYKSFMAAVRKYNNVYYDTHEIYIAPIVEYMIYKYLIENYRDELDEADIKIIDETYADIKIMEEEYKDNTFDINKVFSTERGWDYRPFKYGIRTKEEEIIDYNFAIRVARNELKWNKISMFLYLLDMYASRTKNIEDWKKLINYMAKVTLVVDRIWQFDRCVIDYVESNHYHMGVLLSDKVVKNVALYYFCKRIDNGIDSIKNDIIYRLFEDNVLRPVENADFSSLADEAESDVNKIILNEPILLRADFSAMTEEDFNGFVTDSDVHNFILEVYYSFYNAYTFPIDSEHIVLREMVNKCIDLYPRIYSEWVLPKIVDQIKHVDDREYLKSSMEHTYLGGFIDQMHNHYIMSDDTYKAIIKTMAKQVCLGWNIDD